MGRAPCCEKIGLRRGRWTAEEDKLLSDYIQAHGEGSWRSLPKNAGLLRCGKSCRLRWINYLRSDVKRGNISAEEEDLIIKLHASLGNRWSLIAGHLAGRTDNEIKNYWNSHLSRKISPPSPTIPTKRRSSALKSRKPRKKSSTLLRPAIDKQSSTNPSGDGRSVGEPVPDSFPSDVGEIENVLDDFFDEEGQLNVDPINGVLNLTDQQNVVSDINMDVENSSGQVVESGSAASSTSTNDSNEGKEFGQDWEWECDWEFEIGNNDMVGLGLGFGGEEEDDIMSWPWVDQNDNPTQVMGVDMEKQDEMIAWLLS